MKEGNICFKQVKMFDVYCGRYLMWVFKNRKHYFSISASQSRTKNGFHNTNENSKEKQIDSARELGKNYDVIIKTPVKSQELQYDLKPPHIRDEHQIYRSKLVPLTCVEICLSDIDSAVAAYKGGCTSMEVCSSRIQGGITPSIGLVQEILRRHKNEVEVHVLIRPRPGDFNYSDNEFDVMLRDILMFMNAGVDGIVVGLLTSSGDVDMSRMKVVRELAKDISLTFHRAFDVSRDPGTALQDILSLPCNRLLTSGCCSSAYEGRYKLKELVHETSRTNMKIVAAAGVNSANVGEILEFSGVYGVHAGSSVCGKKGPVDDPDLFSTTSIVCDTVLDDILCRLDSDDADNF